MQIDEKVSLKSALHELYVRFSEKKEQSNHKIKDKHTNKHHKKDGS